jgi:hypothetical protein
VCLEGYLQLSEVSHDFYMGRYSWVEGRGMSVACAGGYKT